jgi:hypothetical protein
VRPGRRVVGRCDAAVLGARAHGVAARSVPRDEAAPQARAPRTCPSQRRPKNHAENPLTLGIYAPWRETRTIRATQYTPRIAVHLRSARWRSRQRRSGLRTAGPWSTFAPAAPAERLAALRWNGGPQRRRRRQQQQHQQQQ